MTTAGLWVDAHLHADKYGEAERDAMLRGAFEDGIAAVVAVSTDLASCEMNRALARRFAGRVLPAYGFHPEQPVPDATELDTMFRWIRERNAEGERFAIGEVGLPYYTRTDAERKGQPFDERPHLELLDRFAALAAELDRPLVLHAVYEDADKALDAAERRGVRRLHFHWFKGAESTVKRMIDLRCRISVTPDVLYEEEIRSLVRTYPLELTMTETDGPWPFEGPFAGKPTRPAMVKEAAKAIAALKEMPVLAVQERLLQNAVEFYELQG
ncbi:TatD family hydrolase [Paenibacillus humicola]|uniref:TatD family hydrolase n=1 Tax=Paenibacillus humicola TaxID=3110540 RepID=UPI00237C434D|nr:TatD family hydrolase [Paenibacillus humicola]